MNDATPDGGDVRQAGQPAEAGQTAEAGPRLAVIIGRQPGQIGEWRVDDPGRVLRAWSMLKESDQELHEVSLPPGAESRLGRQLQALAGELERALSPALTAELRRLLGLSGSGEPTPGELRVEYAGMLGWTSGLVVAMLGQVQGASTRRTAAPGPEAHPGE
jgi:hypothetical protein